MNIYQFLDIARSYTLTSGICTRVTDRVWPGYAISAILLFLLKKCSVTIFDNTLNVTVMLGSSSYTYCKTRFSVSCGWK